MLEKKTRVLGDCFFGMLSGSKRKSFARVLVFSSFFPKVAANRGVLGGALFCGPSYYFVFWPFNHYKGLRALSGNYTLEVFRKKI